MAESLTRMPGHWRFEKLCDDLAARLESAGVTEAALQATLPEVREQVMKRRYPKLIAGGRQRAAGKTKAAKAKRGREE